MRFSLSVPSILVKGVSAINLPCFERDGGNRGKREPITDDGGTLALSGLLTANSALAVYQDFLAFTFNCSVGIFVPNSPSVRDFVCGALSSFSICEVAQ